VLAYLVRRLLALIPTWLAIGVLAFLIINLAPGDPTATLLGTESPQNVALLRERLGLDRPLLERLGLWVLGMLRGDLGDSFFLGRSVVQAIGERLPVTLSLAFWGMMMSMLIGVPLGLLASLRPNGLRDTAVMGFSLLGLSIPEFFLGLILMMVFAISLRVLPVGEYRPLSQGLIPWLRHLILPSLSLGLIWAAYVARITRSSMLEVLNQEYILTARAKGLHESRVVWKHAFRNAILPVVTVLGMIFALLLSGAFITEYLFRLPGAGSLIIAAVKRRDYPVVQGGLLIFSSSILLINLVVDVLYAYIDPRIKYGKR
jgi:peptide/nickel transport system permease protein